jgi:pimeloyl-ACP methyl ester carboxylesterase
MSIEGMAKCIKELLNYEGIIEETAISILGHSMGGYIALALIQEHPTLFSSFGLIHSTAFADSLEKKVARKKSIEFIQANGSYDFLKTTIPNLFYKGQFVLQDKLNPLSTCINDLIRQGKNFTAQALIAYYTAMLNRPDRITVLQTFAKPILFIIGEHDLAVPFSQSMQQCHLPQQSHVHILRHTAHMGMWEEVEKTNNAIELFLSFT